MSELPPIGAERYVYWSRWALEDPLVRVEVIGHEGGKLKVRRHSEWPLGDSEYTPEGFLALPETREAALLARVKELSV